MTFRLLPLTTRAFLVRRRSRDLLEDVGLLNLDQPTAVWSLQNWTPIGPGSFRLDPQLLHLKKNMEYPLGPEIKEARWSRPASRPRLAPAPPLGATIYLASQ
jgi:hypothetical protein